MSSKLLISVSVFLLMLCSGYSAAETFCSKVLEDGAGAYEAIDEKLEQDYKAYFRYREFLKREANRRSPGWTNTMLRQAKRAAASIYAFSGGSYIKLIVGDRVIDYVVAKGHGIYTSSTRHPVAHGRVEHALDRLRALTKRARQEVVDQVLREYLPTKSAYFRSNSSHAVVRILTHYTTSIDDKVEALMAYLEKKSTIGKFEHLYQNNGKCLFNIIIRTSETV